MGPLSRGSRELSRLEKRHGLEPRHSPVERWIAKVRHSFVENLHLETARSPVVRSAGRSGPNVKVQLDPTVAGHRNLHLAQRCLTDAIRDSDPRQMTWNGCHWPVHAEQAVYPVSLMALGPSHRSYPDDCHWPVDAELAAWPVKPRVRVLRHLLHPSARFWKLAYRSGDPPPNGCFPEDAVRNA